MKNLRRIIVIIIVIFTMTPLELFFNSCQSEDKEKKDCDEYLASFRSDINSFLNVPIIVNNDSRAFGQDEFNDGPDTIITVFIDLPDKPINEPDPNLEGLLTPQDMVNLARDYGAEFSMYDDGLHNDSIHISVESARESLTPLYMDSRRFLIQKGLTDNDMDEILSEMSLDSSCLIALALTIAIEEESIMTETAWNNTRYNRLFTSQAYADSAGDIALNCLWKALGIDTFIGYFTYRVTDGITKEIAKRIIKKCAVRMLGWVGAAVALVEFVDCTVHYHRYF